MLDVIIQVGAALGGVGAIGAAVRGSYRHFRRVRGIFERVDAIAREFSPNHGSSLKDQINRIEHAVTVGDTRGRALAAMMRLAMFEADAAGRFVWVSPRWLEITGLSFDEARGHGWRAAIAPSERPDIVRQWETAVAEARMMRAEATMTNGSGRAFRVSIVAEPVLSGSGSTIAYVGSLQVISDRP